VDAGLAGEEQGTAPRPDYSDETAHVGGETVLLAGGERQLGQAVDDDAADRVFGVFLAKAAVLSHADQAKGLDAVFRSVASFPYGAWLLALLAAGLFCYGLYCLVEARYRDLTPGQ
jgi:Domain of Unknown Function (DUF1206)